MGSTTVVSARVEDELKMDAKQILDRIGLSMSDVIKLMLMKLVEKGSLPFDYTEQDEQLIKP